jgi:sulfide:quinone oxidoreductase
MLHAVPPQVAPDAVRSSPLANADGWCEVDPASLRHVRYRNVFALGDVCSTANAKTVAAIRKQAVVVASNLLAACAGKPLDARYDGYGACPLTVEKGKVILAEFGYGGKLLPTFRLDPTIARRSAWLLKTSVLPWVYWKLMLKGREWLAKSSESIENP